MIKHYLKEILLIILIILNIGYYFLYFKKNNINENIIKEENISFNSNENIINETNNNFVEIKGAVKKPGVYAITNNNIVNDIIIMAGGLNDNAYTKNINLSKKVNDEMVIYIYTKSEYQKNSKKVVNYYTSCACNYNTLNVCTEEKESIIENNSNVYVNEKDETKDNITNETITENKININIASKEELMTLTGIGESKAESIIKYREENGNFENTNDITKVSGISDKMYEKIKDNITV